MKINTFFSSDFKNLKSKNTALRTNNLIQCSGADSVSFASASSGIKKILLNNVAFTTKKNIASLVINEKLISGIKLPKDRSLSDYLAGVVSHLFTNNRKLKSFLVFKDLKNQTLLNIKKRSGVKLEVYQDKIKGRVIDRANSTLIIDQKLSDSLVKSVIESIKIV